MFQVSAKKPKDKLYAEIQLKIQNSIYCDYDLTPFEDDELQISIDDLNSVNIEQDTESDGDKTIFRTQNDRIIKTVKNEEGEIYINVIKQNDEIQYQHIHDVTNDIHKQFIKHTDDFIIKIMTEGELTTTIKKEGSLEFAYFVDRKKHIRKVCIKKPNGDFITSTFNLLTYITETSVLYSDGQWYNAKGDGSKLIIMGINNYMNSLEQSNLENTVVEDYYVKKGIYIAADDSFTGNDVNVKSNLNDGSEFSSIISNDAIFNNDKWILVNGYDNECSKYLDVSMFGDKFENVSNFELLWSESSGFLYYVTREDEIWRTSDADIIQKIINNEDDKFEDNCGYLSYESLDSKQSWEKNHRIMESDPVNEYKNLFDLGVTYKYVDGLNEIIWLKPETIKALSKQ